MIALCSVNDRQHWRGQAYCTTAKPMGTLPRLDDLAPTWDLVMGYKRGRTWEEYTAGYRALLASRWGRVRSWLDSLSPDVDATLLCYCTRKEGHHCHRELLALMLAKHRPDIAVELY